MIFQLPSLALRLTAVQGELKRYENNKLTKINYIDPNLKDLTSIHGYIEDVKRSAKLGS